MKLAPLLLLLIFFAVQWFALPRAKGEYRVYKLGLKYTDNPNEKEKEILSNLDDQQYPTYFQFTNAQQTRLIDHWMCYGRHDHEKRFCQKPSAKGPDSVTASPQQPPVLIQ